MNLILFPVAVVMAILFIGFFDGKDDSTYVYSDPFYGVLSMDKRVRKHLETGRVEYDGRIFDDRYDKSDEVWFVYESESPLINSHQKQKLVELGWIDLSITNKEVKQDG